MYWRIDSTELPSRGVLYNADFEIKIRPLNVGDMKFLATINSNNCTQIINELIQSTTKLTNLDVDDILLCDRMYLCFWLRANSLIVHNGYTFNIQCEHCKNTSEHEVTLNEFDTRYIHRLPGEVYLPGAEQTVKLKIPAISDLKFKYPMNDDLEKIGRCLADFTNEQTKRIFLNNLEAMDFALLLSTVKNLDNGFTDLFTFTCPMCRNSQDFRIRVTDDGLFGGIQLYDILKKIISITKYSGMQISDDMLWMELEIYTDIVNKMIEEENEANAKQKQLMSSKMAGIRQANISKPRISQPSIHK